MGFLDEFKSDPAAQSASQAADARQADILQALRNRAVPSGAQARLQSAAARTAPWMATLTAAELRIMRSHGLRPISCVSATCWMHYGWSWTQGHEEGWATALGRLREEAIAAGANAVVDVKMRTVQLPVEDSMDFTLVGTAVKVEGLAGSQDPVIATVPALEFVKLLEADVIPTGIAIGAHYQWISDWRGTARMSWMGNTECQQLSSLWQQVRYHAHRRLQANARALGNGVLAHVNFSQMFEREVDQQPTQYLARHIVVATTVDARPRAVFAHPIRMLVDMHAGESPLSRRSAHHQSYSSNDDEGAI